MGIKDLTEKILEDYNDIFADIVNVLVFKGKQRIKPETLVNTGVHSQYKNDKNGVLHEQERDVAKYWMNGKVRIALCTSVITDCRVFCRSIRLCISAPFID